MERLDYIARELSKGTKKKYETFVLNAIYQRVNNPELEIRVQQVVRTPKGAKLMDMYLPQLNIQIEVDEGYHNNPSQKERDEQRINLIASAAISSITTHDVPTLFRVQVYDKTLQEVNKEIDECVLKINKRIEENGGIKWLTNDERLTQIKARGYIDTNDFFSTNFECINLVYHKELKSFQRADYKGIWFPVISQKDREGKYTNCRGWINYYEDNGAIIYETSINEKQLENKKKEALKEKGKSSRIVFTKEKDSFYGWIKRFMGLYIAAGWDQKRQAEVWKRIKTKLDIPLK